MVSTLTAVVVLPDCTGAWVPAGAAGDTSGRQLPVRMARGVGLQQDVGMDQNQAVDLETAGQQRQQGELQFQPLQGRHLRAGETGGIGKRGVRDLDCRPQRRFQADLAVQRQGPAGGAFHRLDDLGLVGVGIEAGEQHASGADGEHDDGRDGDQRDAQASGSFASLQEVGPAGRESPAS